MARRAHIKQRAAFFRRREAGLLAQVLPRVVVRYKLWIDDMSGVRSKKYCPFLNVRMVFAGEAHECAPLPRSPHSRMRVVLGQPVAAQHRQKNIHFVASANCYDVRLKTATSSQRTDVRSQVIDMVAPIVEQMRDAEMGFRCCDAHTQQFVRQRGDGSKHSLRSDLRGAGPRCLLKLAGTRSLAITPCSRNCA